MWIPGLSWRCRRLEPRPWSTARSLVAPIRAELQRRRDAAVAALTQAGFKVEPPKAAMYLWVPLPAGPAPLPFAKAALEQNGVVVLPGSAFGPAGEGFFRIALTVGADRLQTAAVRLGEALKELRRGPVATSV